MLGALLFICVNAKCVFIHCFMFLCLPCFFFPFDFILIVRLIVSIVEYHISGSTVSFVASLFFFVRLMCSLISLLAMNL